MIPNSLLMTLVKYCSIHEFVWKGSQAQLIGKQIEKHIIILSSLSEFATKL